MKKTALIKFIPLLKIVPIIILFISIFLSLFYKEIFSFKKESVNFTQYTSLENIANNKLVLLDFFEKENQKKELKTILFNSASIPQKEESIDEDPLMKNLLEEIRATPSDNNVTKEEIFVLKMIIEEDQTVIIDNKLLKIGDKLYNFTINSITKDKVCLTKEKETKCLKLSH